MTLEDFDALFGMFKVSASTIETADQLPYRSSNGNERSR